MTSFFVFDKSQNGCDTSAVDNNFEKGCRKKVHATVPKGMEGGFEFFKEI